MIKRTFRVVLFIFCIGFLSQCNKDPRLNIPNIPSVSPCDTALKTKFIADFDIYEELGLKENESLIEVPTDTISSFNFKIKAKEDYDGYEWRIGEDDRAFTTRSVRLRLPSSTTGSTIKVRLIAKRGGILCTRIPAQTDTIVKSFVVAMPPDDLDAFRFKSTYVQAVCGLWEGVADDEPNKKFVVRIINVGYNFQEQTLSSLGLYLYNLPEGCGGPAYNVPTDDPKRGCGGVRVDAKDDAPRLIVGHNSMYIQRTSAMSSCCNLTPPCCPPMQLQGRLDANDRNKIIINFKTITNTTDFLRDSILRQTTFRGKRI